MPVRDARGLFGVIKNSNQPDSSVIEVGHGTDSRVCVPQGNNRQQCFEADKDREPSLKIGRCHIAMAITAAAYHSSPRAQVQQATSVCRRYPVAPPQTLTQIHGTLGFL